ncbi:two-component sensor histidine kinase [Amycolatopsis sp. NBRC 101858]|uniref:sensor histidine kinase n=1 Tax=Amycolatopsis sp. NBRC 101858 TaxID=3032200 RepID=UPI0024A56A99|nr:HAMP domain-containing sensor histidine kinase [Amycolatopsis sp. NBRC 101858]GLY40125.1 two-component sensor histidine kinase [Amycolatopsis sp. NBRC 101858]
MKRLSLRARLLLLTAGLLLAGLTLVSTLVSDQLEHFQLDRLDGQLRSMTELISRAAGPPPAESPAVRPDLVGPALDLFGTPYVVYLDASGAVAGGLHSARVDGATLPPFDALRTVPTDGTAVDLNAADGSERWRAVARPAVRWGGTVVSAAPLADTDATLTQLRVSSLITGAGLLVVLTAAGWFALGRGLRPLRRIEHTAAAIAGGDLTRRVPVLAPPGTEIGHLSASLNTMLGQLEGAFADRAASEARMRTFVADVSHELRTPLFGIKGSTELYRMGALPEASDVDDAMHRIDREATRLTALTEDLLLLAQLDEAPEDQLDRAPMDLRTLAVDARHDLRTLDPSRTVSLTGPGGLGPPGPAPVDGDEARLRQVVTNLVGNAAAHTPPGTPVRIGVGTADGRAVLEVADDGPGMTAEQADKVFNRFYRADRSRTRTGGADAGLGLSIARSLARAHGGDVELATVLGEGARFRLALPLL